MANSMKQPLLYRYAICQSGTLSAPTLFTIKPTTSLPDYAGPDHRSFLGNDKRNIGNEKTDKTATVSDIESYRAKQRLQPKTAMSAMQFYRLPTSRAICASTAKLQPKTAMSAMQFYRRAPEPDNRRWKSIDSFQECHGVPGARLWSFTGTHRVDK